MIYELNITEEIITEFNEVEQEYTGREFLVGDLVYSTTLSEKPTLATIQGVIENKFNRPITIIIDEAFCGFVLIENNLSTSYAISLYELNELDLTNLE